MASRPRLAGRTASAAYGPYYIVDFLHLAGASPSDSSSGDAALGGSSGCCGRLRALLLKLHLLEALYLVLVGVLSAVLALFVNLFADKLAAQRERLLSSVDHIFHSYSYPRDYFIWILWVVVLALCAALAARFINRNSIGSGIPEMKTILSGVMLYKFLSSRTLLAKVLSLSLGLAAGLSIGREGPFLHIACIVANQLAQHVPLFRALRHDSRSRQFPPLKMQMLSAACAAGVANTFGAPIGGVIFAMEVTSTYYLVETLPKAFLAAVSGAIFLRIQPSIWGHRFSGYLTFLTNLFGGADEDRNMQYQLWEIPLFVILGVLCGILAAMFVRATQRAMQLRDRYFPNHQFVLVVLVSMFTGLLAYPFDFFHVYEMRTIDTLVNPKELEEPWTRSETNSLYANLTIYVVFKLVLTIAAVTLPIASGVYAPSFGIGAALGRLFGESMRSLLHEHGTGDVRLVAAGYAIVGAAALSASVTKSIASAVVVLELTGETHYIVPVLFATLVATGVTRLLECESIYDVIVTSRGLPVMPHLAISKASRRADEIMRTDIPWLEAGRSTYADGMRLLLQPYNLSNFPVVASADTAVFEGAMTRRTIEIAVDEYLQALRLSGNFEDILEEQHVQQRAQPELSASSDSSSATSPTPPAQIPSPSSELDYDSDNDGDEGRALLDGERRPFDLYGAFFGDEEELSHPILQVPMPVERRDPAVLTVSPLTPLKRIDYLLRMVGTEQLWVVDHGVYKGCILKDDVVHLRSPGGNWHALS
eukprot:m.190502 g.190502  ORF g.190502 m.190502 type:complete len:763 (+) comp10582_c0_seq3:734-3022(+)